MSPTAYVVDDHAGFRVVARALLERAGFDVTGDAEDGPAALVDLAERPVDLAIVDLYLSGPDGVHVTRRILDNGLATTVVIVSSREDAGSDPRVAATAAGFIAKRDLTPALLRSLVP